MSDTARGNGLGFGTVLFFIFLVLKLTDTIDWSWWWVTAPLWVPAGVIILALLVAGLCFAAAGFATYMKRRSPYQH